MTLLPTPEPSTSRAPRAANVGMPTLPDSSATELEHYRRQHEAILEKEHRIYYDLASVRAQHEAPTAQPLLGGSPPRRAAVEAMPTTPVYRGSIAPPALIGCIHSSPSRTMRVTESMVERAGKEVASTSPKARRHKISASAPTTPTTIMSGANLGRSGGESSSSGGAGFDNAEAALARCENAVASANASRSTSPSGTVRPSRESVLAAATQLVEAKRALQALKGEVREQLASLQQHLKEDVEEAFAGVRPQRAAALPAVPEDERRAS